MCPLTQRLEPSPNTMLAWASRIQTWLLLWPCEWFLLFSNLLMHFVVWDLFNLLFLHLLEWDIELLGIETSSIISCPHNLFFHVMLNVEQLFLPGMRKETPWVHHTTTMWILWVTLLLVLRWLTVSHPMWIPLLSVPSTSWILWQPWRHGWTTLAGQMLWSSTSGVPSPLSPYQVRWTSKLLTRVLSLDLPWLWSHKLGLE